MTPKNIAHFTEQLLSLETKVAIVTGAASGIGREIAVRLAEVGARVAVLDKNADGAIQTVEKITRSGGIGIAVPCDLRSSSECKRAVTQVIEKFGTVDILCNNAGIVVRKDVASLEEAEWDVVIDVTLKSAYLMSHEVIPHMIRQKSGVIINTGSGWSLKGGEKAAAYCAAKAG